MKQLLLFFLLSPVLSYSQIDSLSADSLMGVYLEDYDPVGYYFFKEEVAQSGEMFLLYSQYWPDDSMNTMTLSSAYTDSNIFLTHNRYQQYYDSIFIQGAQMIEHIDSNGYIIYANGSFAVELGYQENFELLEEEIALDFLLDSLSEREFVWNDSLWEAHLKEIKGDSNSTYYPKGELVWTLPVMQEKAPIYYSSDYTLCWKFNITFLDSFSTVDYFIDMDGAVFKMERITAEDGPCSTLYYGTEIIDTEFDVPSLSWTLNTNGHVLRNIFTRDDPNNNEWAAANSVYDSDGNWGTSNQFATTTHYVVSRAWQYFYDVWAWGGPNRFGSNVYVTSNHIRGNGRWNYDGYFDYIALGIRNSEELSQLDLAGHEYTHGVIYHKSKLKLVNEQGALNEAHSDIFGFLSERYTEDPTSNCNSGNCDWTLGEDGGTVTRDLSSPDVTTYRGALWVNPVSNPNEANNWGGIHTNCDVFNYFFHILADGESGTNDNFYSFNVSGIGIDAASLIVYQNMSTNMSALTNFASVSIGLITTARLLYGEGSPEYVNTVCALAAVGMIDSSPCTLISLDDKKDQVFKLYPNPTSGICMISSDGTENYSFSVRDVKGKLLYSEENIEANKKLSLDLSDYNSGVYFISLTSQTLAETLRVVKN